jgi:hypothetical protein
VVTLVRAGSARLREPLHLGGHQRSRRTRKNRRSCGIHRYDLGRRSSTGQGSNPSPKELPQASGPCQRGTWSPSTGLALRPSWRPSRQASSTAVLPGRAPDVPYTSVRSGHPRTTTVHAHALRAVGSARTERAEGASQARGAACPGPRWVRAPSVARDPSGHERSRRVRRNDKSPCLHTQNLGRWSAEDGFALLMVVPVAILTGHAPAATVIRRSLGPSGRGGPWSVGFYWSA